MTADPILDRHVRDVVRRHFSPETGTPFWLDWASDRGRDVIAEVRANFPGHVFSAVVPRSVRLAEAPSHGTPVTRYDAAGAGAQAYRALAVEVAQRALEEGA